MNKTTGSLAVLLGAASFGILSTFVKKAYAAQFTLAEVTGIQAGLGMILLWMVYSILHSLKNKNAGTANTPAPSASRKTPAYKLLLSGFTTGAVSILYYKSIELVPASLAIILLMQYIWIGQLIERIFFKSKASRSDLLLTVFVLGGTVLAVGALEQPLDSFSIPGILYGLLAATAYASFIIVNGRIGNDYQPIKKSALMITGAFILVCLTLQPFSLLSPERFTGIIRYGLLLSVFGTVLPPLLFAYGMPKTGYPLGSVLSTIELPVAVLMSYFVLHESVSWLKWLGVLIILATILWKNIQAMRMQKNRQYISPR